MSPRTRNTVIVIATVVVAFGIGAAWQFAQADRARRDLATTTADLEAARYELQLERLQSTLALATVASQFGNYERARQLMSDFFTALQTSAVDAPAAARSVFDDILGGRDAIITSLSRSEPGSGLELARILGRFRDALGMEPVGLSPEITPSGAPAPATADTMS